jgi:hypothetical protein
VEGYYSCGLEPYRVVVVYFLFLFFFLWLYEFQGGCIYLLFSEITEDNEITQRERRAFIYNPGNGWMDGRVVDGTKDGYNNHVVYG